MRNLMKTKEKFGGAKRDRTADLNTASVALSQLSYSPVLCGEDYTRFTFQCKRIQPLSSLLIRYKHQQLIDSIEGFFLTQ